MAPIAAWARDVPPWLDAHYQLFAVALILYPLLVHHARWFALAPTRPGVDRWVLRPALAAWNAALAAFSAAAAGVMLVRWAPRLLRAGYHESVCLEATRGDSFLHDPVLARWLWLFMLSKLAELGDTAFLALRGRPIGFLHWYHHAATLGAAYVQSARCTTTIEWASAMNLAVHAWMYARYAAATVWPARFRGGCAALTALQLAQMAHGVFMTAYHALACRHEPPDWVGMAMYAAYAGLFASFYARRYRRPPP